MNERVIFQGLFDIDRSGIYPATFNWYLEKLGSYIAGFDYVSTAGDIRPPYRFQWRCRSIVFEGHDDCYEGFGGTPHEAVKALYREMKQIDL